MSRLFDIRSPFFLPLYRRVVVAAVLGAWTLLEFSRGAVMFGIIFAAATAWVVWCYFIVFKPEDYGEKSDD